ncbi:carboxylate--amine ligase [Actinomyces polynesiensis]|uniref:carboxylate--amine ligase n=1 Tax=Actinomyces polynesiensis TaxID=1325934 RepID=UPI000AC06572|nr:carboxylate--amine ligase [Actinomyces polynesiensis]
MSNEVHEGRGDILPVVLGGDIGVYGIGRSFHEAFGVSSIAVASAPTAAIARSSVFQTEHLPAHADDATVLAVLRGLAAANRDRHLVLMANHDVHSAFVARHAEELSQWYALPFPDLDIVEHVTDKAAFARVCEDLGVPTPGTVLVDLSGAGEPGWSAPGIPFEFPVVAKAARGDVYDAVQFEGKRKIWFVEHPSELEDLWATLAGAGFRGTFLVQELVPGDNTQMRSITAYVDSTGRTSLVGSARVLLEDHAPTMIGNPVAMITEPFEQLWEDARRILEHTGYRGFANFDVKVDPRDGRALFFEVNPRIGRNNWYMTAGGCNPMVPMVSDLVDHVVPQPEQLRAEVLYSLVPDRLLLHYLRDDALRERVRGLIDGGRRFDPLEYPAEKDLRRRAVVALQKANQYRKFHRYYPEATDRSF